MLLIWAIIIKNVGIFDNRSHSGLRALLARRPLPARILYSQGRTQLQCSQHSLQNTYYPHPHPNRTATPLPHRWCSEQPRTANRPQLILVSIVFLSPSQSGFLEADSYLSLWARSWWSLLEDCPLDFLWNYRFSWSVWSILRDSLVLLGRNINASRLHRNRRISICIQWSNHWYNLVSLDLLHKQSYMLCSSFFLPHWLPNSCMLWSYWIDCSTYWPHPWVFQQADF